MKALPTYKKTHVLYKTKGGKNIYVN